MKKTVSILSLLVLLLGVWAAALWLSPFNAYNGSSKETRYGVHEGLELVEQENAQEGKRYVVEDEDGKELFVIPLRGCLLDTRYRNGQLRFREKNTKREGYIDRQGGIFLNENAGEYKSAEDRKDFANLTGEKKGEMASGDYSDHHSGEYSGDYSGERKGLADRPSAGDTESTGGTGSTGTAGFTASAQPGRKSSALSQVNLKTMAQSNPFYREASKIMQGKLTETDAKRRHTILNYCEHFRIAYTTKDINFLRQVFSDKALIIVGNVVKPIANDDKCQAESRVTFAIHSKRDYLARLSKVFAANQKIDVRFSGFRIMRHPTIDGIYGVTLRQQYKSNRYSDDGYLFLLWDFRDKSMPLIHVRTWQPAGTVHTGNDVINIQDFNLE